MRARRMAEATPAFDALVLGRFTWIGLAVGAIGWALLIGELAVADVAARGARAPSLHGDIVGVAQCLIGSGFALAIIGALNTGFGTLNRFFEAVLLRSAQRATAPAPSGSAVRGAHPFRKLPDGSVEVETILGTRRFASMREAADFL